MESILIKALQLILCLSIIVVIHELGHFFFARIFKIRVEKFYLFFNPWFSLFKYKPKNSDTEYGIGWLPLGGYVKISGMIDESMDKEQMAQPAQDWEFRAKPSWQRLLVMIGGVVFNFILAFFIYSMILFTWGKTYEPLKDARYGMEFSETAKSAGFQDGDILLKADDLELQSLSGSLIPIVDANEVLVLRNGVETKIAIPDDFMQSLLRNKDYFCNFKTPSTLHLIQEGSPAEKAGLKVNDSIIAIDGKSVQTYLQIKAAAKDKENSKIQVNFIRDNVQYKTTLALGEKGIMGTGFEDPITTTITYSFFESFPSGIKLGVSTLKNYVTQFKYVFTKEGASSLGGFGALGSLFPSAWNWQAFWMMTAFISVALGFMNILPIPALDGGHVMFLLYEMITGRKPNEKFMEYAQVAGMALLLLLLLYANGNDVFRAIFK